MVGIYLIRNRVSGKCYVGQAMDIEERWKQHIRDSKKKVKQTIHRAIDKYGIENFEFSILELCSADELDEKEISWIEKLDTYNNGYNCTLGGGGRNQGKNCYSKEYKMAKDKKKYEAHKDEPEFKKKNNARVKAYYEANKEKERVRKKAYYEANKENLNATQKAYYEANKEKCNAASKAWKDAHKEQIKEYNKSYKEAHKFTPDHTDMPLF